MFIRVVAVGKIRERYLQEGIREYRNRLQRYGNLEVMEIPDEAVSPAASASECDQVRRKEGLRIQRHLPERAVVVALTPEGAPWSSEDMARHLGGWEVDGPHTVVFLIGGELGLSAEILEKSDHRLSLSPMTFPHQLVRLILFEQLYRAFRILRGEPYHR